MIGYRRTLQIDSDLTSLKVATERAGLALACLFSSSDEFEADIIRVRRAQGAFKVPHPGREMIRSATATFVLAFTFLML